MKYEEPLTKTDITSQSKTTAPNIVASAKEKNIYGTKIFLLDGTEIEDNDVLREYQNEVLILANEVWDEIEKTSSVASHTTASELSVPNSPTSSVENVNVLVKNIIDELMHHVNIPSRSNFRAIARELCNRYLQLYDRDPDTIELIGFGYWTIFKKLEERVHYLQRPHKRAPNSTCSVTSTTRKKSKIIKNLSAGCKEWQPSVQVTYEDEEIAPETKKTWLISNAFVKERDESKVELYMNDTYGLQRTFLNSTPPPSVTSIANEWPILLEEKYMIIHFDRLCGLNSNLCMDTFRSKVTKLHDTIKSLIPKKLVNALDNNLDDTEKNDVTLLQLIAKYFKEDLSYIYMKYEEPLTKTDITSQSKTTAPNIVASGIGNISYLLVEKTIVCEVGSSSVLQVLFAAYYNFNMAYPVQCQNTLEFLQRLVFKINPNEGSKVRKGRILNKVLSLMAKLK